MSTIVQLVIAGADYAGYDDSGATRDYLTVNAYSHGVSNYASVNKNSGGASAGGMVSPVKVQMDSCPASSMLEQACFKGTVIPSAVFNFYKNEEGSNVLVKTITLTKARIAGVSDVVTGGNEMASISIAYDELKTDWKKPVVKSVDLTPNSQTGSQS